jgi:O-antigen ligase
LIYRFQESLGNSTVSGFGERATFWRVHVAIIAQNPWFGEGSYWLGTGLREAYYNTLGYASFDKKYNAHNIFLQLLADVGVTGCMALIACMASCTKQLKKQLASRTGQKYYHALRAAFVAELLMGLTQNSLSDAPVMITLLGFFWILVWEDTLVA